MTMTIQIRPASRDDAPHLARLIDFAAEGLPSHLWRGMAAPGQDPMEVGTERAARDTGGFSWRNGRIAEIGGAVAGGLIAWRLPEAPEPIDGLPPVLQPLQQLENRVCGTLYINAFGVFPGFRRRGVGRSLLAETLATPGPVSLIMASGNAPALALYSALGFAEVARAPVVRDGWHCKHDDWVLMLRPALAKRGESV